MRIFLGNRKPKDSPLWDLCVLQWPGTKHKVSLKCIRNLWYPIGTQTYETMGGSMVFCRSQEMTNVSGWGIYLDWHHRMNKAQKTPQDQLWGKLELPRGQEWGRRAHLHPFPLICLHFDFSWMPFYLVVLFGHQRVLCPWFWRVCSLQIGFCSQKTVCQRGGWPYHLHVQLYCFIRIQWGSGDGTVSFCELK